MFVTAFVLACTSGPITLAQSAVLDDTCRIRDADSGTCLDQFYSSNDINFFDTSDKCGGTGVVTNQKSNLTIEQKIAQTFIVGFDPTDTATMSQLVGKYKLGGLFFVGGDDNSKLTKEFFAQLNQSAGAPLFIAADDEGGQVARFTKNITPSAQKLGEMNTPQIEAEGKKAGDLLVAAGLNGDLAPVLDLYNEGTPWAQTERNFASDPLNVSAKAGAFAKGLKAAGITPVFKHFPGIGKVKEHTDKIPSTPQELNRISADLRPFKDLANKHGAAIMLSNGFITDWDANVPVSINPKAVEYLRNTINFTGVIMTDALEVLAKESYGSKAVQTPDAIARALKAGVDMPLFVLQGGDQTIQAAIDKVKADVPVDRIENAYQKSLTIRTGSTSDTQTTAQGGNASQCCSTTGSAVSVTLTGKDNIEKILSFLMGKGLTLAQAAGVIGNFQQEATPAINPAIIQGGAIADDSYTPVNGVGFGIAQWTFTARQGPLVAKAKEMNLPVNKLEVQLEFLWQELNGSHAKSLTSLKASQTPEDAAYVFHRDFEQSNDSESAIRQNRGGPARKVYDQYADGAPLSGSGSTATPVSTASTRTCGSSTGGATEGNGDIAKTALALAWPNKGKHPGTDKSAARDTYQEAMPKFNNHTDITPWTDCGVFTATVIRMSGADPKYPGRGTSVQLQYVRTSDTVEVVPITDTSQLEPGLVAVVAGTSGVGHTYIYTGPYKGDDGEDYDIAQASLGGHVPEAGKVYLSDNRGPYTFGRIKKLTQV